MARDAGFSVTTEWTTYSAEVRWLPSLDETPRAVEAGTRINRTRIWINAPDFSSLEEVERTGGEQLAVECFFYQATANRQRVDLRFFVDGGLEHATAPGTAFVLLEGTNSEGLTAVAEGTMLGSRRTIALP